MTVACVLSVMAAGAVIGQVGNGPTRVAIVSIPVVSQNYQKTTDLEAKFEEIRQKLNRQREAMKDKIIRMGRSLQEAFKPGTDEFRERRKQLAMLEAELQWFDESEGQRVDRGLADSLKEIYTDIQEVVRKVAEQEGIDIVLTSDQLPPTAPDSVARIRQQILLQKVIYWNPRVDITDKVVAQLNSKYRRDRSGSSAATAPPREPHDGRDASTWPPTPAGDRPKYPRR